MLLSVHVAETGPLKALTMLGSKPSPSSVDGLRYAEAWLMSPFRTGGMMPSTDINGVMLVAAWESDGALDRFLDHRTARPYAQGWRARFEPVRTVGAWPPLPDLPRQERDTGDDPVAVLTMARMRLPRVPAFAAAAAPAEREAVRHPAYLGGASLMRPMSLIATFSMWRNVREMRQYTVGAYPGGHRDAMHKHDQKVFHHETVFVRLRPYSVEGEWNGRNPLDMIEPLRTG